MELSSSFAGCHTIPGEKSGHPRAEERRREPKDRRPPEETCGKRSAPRERKERRRRRSEREEERETDLLTGFRESLQFRKLLFERIDATLMLMESLLLVSDSHHRLGLKTQENCTDRGQQTLLPFSLSLSRSPGCTYTGRCSVPVRRWTGTRKDCSGIGVFFVLDISTRSFFLLGQSGHPTYLSRSVDLSI